MNLSVHDNSGILKAMPMFSGSSNECFFLKGKTIMAKLVLNSLPVNIHIIRLAWQIRMSVHKRALEFRPISYILLLDYDHHGQPHFNIDHVTAITCTATIRRSWNLDLYIYLINKQWCNSLMFSYMTKSIDHQPDSTASFFRSWEIDTFRRTWSVWDPTLVVKRDRVYRFSVEKSEIDRLWYREFAR